MYQPLPDAALVWRPGRIEYPLNTFLGKFSCNIVCIPQLDILTELFFRTHEGSTTIWPNHGKCTPKGDKPLSSVYTLVSVHWREDFPLDSLSSQTSGEEFPPLPVVQQTVT